MHHRSISIGTIAAIAVLIAPAAAQRRLERESACSTAHARAVNRLIVGSHQPMACRFTPMDHFRLRPIPASSNTIGLDVGFTAGGALAWAVFAPTSNPFPGALAGVYVGASAISPRCRVGANVLFGGSGSTIALQPISLEGTVSVKSFARRFR